MAAAEDGIVYLAKKRPCAAATLPGIPRPDGLAPPAGRPCQVSETAFLRVDPLFLFCRGLQWKKYRDAGAGWELVQALKSWDVETRVVAASLLGSSEYLHLPVGPLRRKVSAVTVTIEIAPLGKSAPKEVQTMNTPYGLEIIDSCMRCKLRKDKWFCGLSPDVLKAFDEASHASTYPGNALLFVEGQSPRGAYVLCSGRVKLSTTSRDGKVLILKVADAGEVLGLSAVISETPYELTAETSGPCQVNFIERDALLRLMEKYGELGLRSAQTLSREFQSMYRDIHELVLARSSAGKLARLILSWTPGREGVGVAEVRVRSSITHEEMAQMIGASRETVTRLLSELKKKELIRLEGSMLVIRNRTALEALAA